MDTDIYNINHYKALYSEYLKLSGISNGSVYSYIGDIDRFYKWVQCENADTKISQSFRDKISLFLTEEEKLFSGPTCKRRKVSLLRFYGWMIREGLYLPKREEAGPNVFNPNDERHYKPFSSVISASTTHARIQATPLAQQHFNATIVANSKQSLRYKLLFLIVLILLSGYAYYKLHSVPQSLVTNRQIKPSQKAPVAYKMLISLSSSRLSLDSRIPMVINITSEGKDAYPLYSLYCPDIRTYIVGDKVDFTIGLSCHSKPISFDPQNHKDYTVHVNFPTINKYLSKTISSIVDAQGQTLGEADSKSFSSDILVNTIDTNFYSTVTDNPDNSAPELTKLDYTNDGLNNLFVTVNQYGVLPAKISDPVFGVSSQGKIVKTGIVYVKFSGVNGPILKGDYITIGSVSGVAIKVDASQQILGVALEDSSRSTNNVIKVLIK